MFIYMQCAACHYSAGWSMCTLLHASLASHSLLLSFHTPSFFAFMLLMASLIKLLLSFTSFINTSSTCQHPHLASVCPTPELHSFLDPRLLQSHARPPILLPCSGNSQVSQPITTARLIHYLHHAPTHQETHSHLSIFLRAPTTYFPFKASIPSSLNTPRKLLT